MSDDEGTPRRRRIGNFKFPDTEIDFNAVLRVFPFLIPVFRDYLGLFDGYRLTPATTCKYYINNHTGTKFFIQAVTVQGKTFTLFVVYDSGYFKHFCVFKYDKKRYIAIPYWAQSLLDFTMWLDRIVFFFRDASEDEVFDNQIWDICDRLATKLTKKFRNALAEQAIYQHNLNEDVREYDRARQETVDEERQETEDEERQETEDEERQETEDEERQETVDEERQEAVEVERQETVDEESEEEFLSAVEDFDIVLN